MGLCFALSYILKAVCFNFVVKGMNRLTPFCYCRNTVIFLFCNPEWHIDRFSHFCIAHGRESLYLTTGRLFPPPLKLPLPMGI